MSKEVSSPGGDTKVELVGEWQDGVGEHVLTVHNSSGSKEALAMWRWWWSRGRSCLRVDGLELLQQSLRTCCKPMCHMLQVTCRFLPTLTWSCFGHCQSQDRCLCLRIGCRLCTWIAVVFSCVPNRQTGCCGWV